MTKKVALNEAIDRETVELYRSKEMLDRKERDARTADQSALVGEEKRRLKRHQDELRRLLRAACLSGSVSFRGNDRSPRDGSDAGKVAAEILGATLVGPEVTELLPELTLAQMMELTPAEIARNVHAHPTLSEALMEAAHGAEGQAIHI